MAASRKSISQPAKLEESTITVSLFEYELSQSFKAARERLGLAPGVVGALTGVFHCDPDDIILEQSGSMYVYHNKKLNKKPKALLREITERYAGYDVRAVGSEERPRIGPGRRHPWAKKTLWRTLIRSLGPTTSSEPTE